MIELKAFGGLRLAGGSGTATELPRRRLALLALLAVAGDRGLTRERLVTFLWPDASAESGRHSLEQLLSTLRRQLGETLFLGTDPVRLNPPVMTSDVGEFEAALQRDDRAAAVAAYQGPFLDGFYLSEVKDFEEWVERERARLADKYTAALERLAVDARGRGDHAEAVGWWRALVLADPVGTRGAVGLMRSLAAVGDCAGAMQHARVYETLVREQLEMPPDPAVTALVRDLQAGRELPGVKAGAGPQPPAAQPAPRGSAAISVAPVPLPSDRLSPGASEPPALRARASRRSLLAGLLALAAVAGVAVLARIARSRAPDGTRTITVLPFRVSGDQDAKDLADGLAEDLSRALGTLKLRVISHASAAALASRGLSPTVIGDSLGARYIVEGLLQEAGGRIRLNSNLTDARDGTVLWPGRYELPLRSDSLFAMRDEIVRAIAEELHVALSSTEGRTPASRPGPNLEAYLSYRRGRHFWDRRNLEGVQTAIRYFQQAIARDSGYALAYVGLADAYTTLGIGNVGDFQAREYFPLAHDAAVRALTLDSTLAEAHAALGFIRLLDDQDWDAAERELSRALELNPSYATAHAYRAILLEWTSRFEPAVREAREGLLHDPLSLFANVELGRAFFFARQYDSAAAQLRQTLELDSTFLRARLHLGQVYLQQRRFDEAIRELERAGGLARRSSRPLSLLGHAYATAGRRADALRLLDSLSRRADRDYVPAFDFAIIYAGLGELDETFAWLDRAITDRSIRPYLMDPTFDAIRSDARYASLLRALRLEPRPVTGQFDVPPRPTP